MQFALRGHRRLLVLVSTGVMLVAIGLLAMGGSAHARAVHGFHHSHPGNGGLSITSQPWGSADGSPVSLYSLSNGNGMSVRITNYGGVVQSIWVPDRTGQVRNVVLGFSNLQDYVTDFTNPPAGGSGDTYFGAIIGRYANRIGNHQFTLDGHTYVLPGNNGPNNINTLHGGPNAWNTKVWNATPETGPNFVALKLTYTDPDGTNGFPGTVQAQVTYILTQDNALRIEYRATTDKPTVINLTNHSYFNLAGEGNGLIYHQLLQINADQYTPTDANLIPTGQISPVAGTPFDFTHMKPIGRDIDRADLPDGGQLVAAHGYDQNWVLNGSGMRLAAIAQDPKDGIGLWTYTDQPGVQLYTSNFLEGDLVGTSGRTYRQGAAFTLETQHYPDSPNEPSFPSTTLNPGQVFSSATIYKFTDGGGRPGHGGPGHGHH